MNPAARKAETTRSAERWVLPVCNHGKRSVADAAVAAAGAISRGQLRRSRWSGAT